MSKNFKYRQNTRSIRAFTLIELVVVMGVFAAIIFGLYLSFNSKAILDRTGDTKRMRDITEIKHALEIYYQDNNCYPTEAYFNNVIKTKAEWSVNGMVYIKEIPLDPLNHPYVYKAGDSDCPQWMAVFARLTDAPTRYTACPISDIPNCGPSGIESNWACVTSGSADCSYLGSTTVDFDQVPLTPGPTNAPTPTSQPQAPTNTPAPTPTGGPIPTPTLTPTPPACSPANWRCTGSPPRCNAVPAGTGDRCNSTCDGAC